MSTPSIQFSPEVGKSMFLQSVGVYLQVHTQITKTDIFTSVRISNLIRRRCFKDAVHHTPCVTAEFTRNENGFLESQKLSWKVNICTKHKQFYV
jgi:hypothetical protein